MEKYADLPMDLADASLVILAEERGMGVFFPLIGVTLKPIAGKTINLFKIYYYRTANVTPTQTHCHERARLYVFFAKRPD